MKEESKKYSIREIEEVGYPYGLFVDGVLVEKGSDKRDLLALLILYM